MSRVCPFPHCGKQIDPRNFACRDHWASMDKKDQKDIYNCYGEWQSGLITGDQLREKQAEVMEKYNKAFLQGAASQAHDAQSLARLAREYIKKRKEYTACKDGFLDKKAKIGGELSRLEKRLADACEEILNPPKPTLFENPPDEDEKPQAKPPH